MAAALPLLMTAGSVYGANKQAKAAKDATSAQVAAANSEMELQKAMYSQSRQDMQPWMQAGQGGLSALMKLAGFTPTVTPGYTKPGTVVPTFKGGGGYQGDSNELGAIQQAIQQAQAERNDPSMLYVPESTSWAQTGNPTSALQMDPGYQFRMDEGMNTLENSAAARGGLLSGNFLKNSQRFGQDYAANEYQNAFNRLAALSGVGQAQAGQLANLGNNYANQAGQGMQRIGDARASGYAARANANTGLINNLTGLGSMAMMGAFGGGGGYAPAAGTGAYNFSLPGM